ncbi:MFS transporter [Campylobacter sp. LH-2024]|uniref:MFS transporter n=1 Tax=Campylobacter TaxID=194 RepID=UPI001D3AA574|nr:MFS transporter [Campylobacter sp. W0065]MBZ7937271.1 MFS transporter [Campylobacter sp. RM10538]MBZ7947830.1 MFS transporter [Campylobacter sp. RM9929]MBZ7950568.1 MFS transporter [Campylobacter sp. W0046]MBZ7955196.1 MFS transporter [Campylobacter sp. RM17709]MBZ7959820.1 MFS transporter [Campylobacter sp. RM12397]MBZ7960749.1 MFS transporter [Campylobacter sp. RM9930]MBZ7970120.1 MFS transporter [Campylobacter sp. RM3125]MBZ7971795.1 MFS transporter [Campylobacter sp. RM3124]MBZ79728
MQNYKKALFALALSAFCMGVTEFVMAGVLIDVQHYFKIDAKTAGYLTTLYAIGVVVGAPIISIALSHFYRHIQLLINLGIFALANLTIFFSNNFYLTAFARFVAGTQHGVFFVIATLAISSIAPNEKKSSALAIMVTGLTVALVTGVPLGTFIGYHFGFKLIFLLIFIITIFASLGVWHMMPKKLYPNPTNLQNLAPAFSHRNLLKTYTITLCSCGAQFILYTYLQKLLIDISGFKEQNTTYILLLYGICAIFGNLWGGKMVDKKGAIFSLRLILSIQIFVFLNFLWTIYIPILIIFNIALMGFFSFSTIPALKMLSIAKAKRHTYKIMDSTISVNEAAFNVGIALASFIGGLVLTNIGIEFNALFASIFILPALIFSLIFSKDKINYKHFKRKVE